MRSDKHGESPVYIEKVDFLRISLFVFLTTFVIYFSLALLPPSSSRPSTEPKDLSAKLRPRTYYRSNRIESLAYRASSINLQ